MEPQRGQNVKGARTASSPAEAANGAEVVWMCVSDTKAVEGLLFGKQGIEQSLAEGMIVVDSSTISPSAHPQVRRTGTRQGRATMWMLR